MPRSLPATTFIAARGYIKAENAALLLRHSEVFVDPSGPNISVVKVPDVSNWDLNEHVFNVPFKQMKRILYTPLKD